MPVLFRPEAKEMVHSPQEDSIANRHRSRRDTFTHLVDGEHFHARLSNLHDRNTTIFTCTIEEISGKDG